MSTALVTGASRGFGEAVARGLAAAGWHVVVDARDAPALDTAMRDVPGVVAVPGSIADASHRRALAATLRRAGGADLIVLNAGVLGPSPMPRLDHLAVGDLRAAFEVNVVAQVALLQALLPRLRPAATVVAVTSDAAVEAYPGWGVYAATKAALEQVFAIWAAERPDLRLLRVDPGDMRTRMHADAFPGEDISDRPLPDARVPPLLSLLRSGADSGRHRLEDVRVPASPEVTS